MQKIEIDSKQLSLSDYRANEAFKALRTNIMFCGDEVKVIALTSATPGEGKSSISLNLAVSLSEMGKKVIFIDADLRKSNIRQKYKIGKATEGFSHYLSGIKPFGDVVYSTNYSNLHVILAGPVPPNPSELLGGKHFRLLIEALRSTYDYVIIDTPPVGSVTDALVVAKQCDGIAVVISSNTTSYKFEQRIITDIKKSGSRILGVILNKVELSDNSYYGSYYGKYYGNYGEGK